MILFKSFRYVNGPWSSHGPCARVQGSSYLREGARDGHPSASRRRRAGGSSGPTRHRTRAGTRHPGYRPGLARGCQGTGCSTPLFPLTEVRTHLDSPPPHLLTRDFGLVSLEEGDELETRPVLETPGCVLDELPAIIPLVEAENDFVRPATEIRVVRCDHSLDHDTLPYTT